MSYGSCDWRRKVVAVDYDDTISHNDTAWLSVLLALENIGYQVIIVTYRKPDCCPEDLDFLVKKGYKVYYTSQLGKRMYLKEFLKIDVDIWIDDTPESILFDYSTYLGKFDVDKERVK